VIVSSAGTVLLALLTLLGGMLRALVHAAGDALNALLSAR